MSLNNNRILICGGTSGIGLAVAQAAASQGAEIIIVSREQGRADAAVQQLGGRSCGFAADVADEGAVKGLFQKVGKFDHLVFTSGDAVWQGLLAETEADAAKQFFDVRFWGAVFVAKHGAPLIRPSGSITLTASTLARRPSPGFLIGASVSSAVEALGRGLALELAPVRVNIVAPGIIRTPLWNILPEKGREVYFANRGAALPVGRVGVPEDVAEAYLYLMRGSFTTGQTVVVDGGMLLV